MSVSFCYPCVRSVQQGLPLRVRTVFVSWWRRARGHHILRWNPKPPSGSDRPCVDLPGRMLRQAQHRLQFRHYRRRRFPVAV